MDVQLDTLLTLRHSYMLVGWLVDLILNVLVNNFSVMSEPPIPGYYQYLWGVNVPCSRTKQGSIRTCNNDDILFKVRI